MSNIVVGSNESVYGYGIAAAYGFVSFVPLYSLLEKVGHDAPPGDRNYPLGLPAD